MPRRELLTPDEREALLVIPQEDSDRFDASSTSSFEA